MSFAYLLGNGKYSVLKKKKQKQNFISPGNKFFFIIVRHEPTTSYTALLNLAQITYILSVRKR